MLDQQEKAWNAMIYYWSRRPDSVNVPLPSPEARTVGEHEVIRRFP